MPVTQERKNMKILLCGDIDSGKTTLIRRLVADMGAAPRGYITVRMPEVGGVSKVYLYDIANPPERVEDAAVIMAISDTGTAISGMSVERVS